MRDNDYMQNPCKHCPFRRDVRPFLHPDRGAELAFHAQNQYNSFPCHKTTVANEDSEEGEIMYTETTKECHGFTVLKILECGDQYTPEGFEPAYDLIYNDSYEMAEVYSNPDEYFEE